MTALSGCVGGWALAQINIARLIAPEGDPRVQDFFDSLDPINALADASPGFLWRLEGYGGNATNLDVAGDERVIVNMSAWNGIEALRQFVYQSAHRPVMVRRREWFERPESCYQALWWIPAGKWPTPEEGLARLKHLEQFGPTHHAFTFKSNFAPPSANQRPGRTGAAGF